MTFAPITPTRSQLWRPLLRPDQALNPRAMAWAHLAARWGEPAASWCGGCREPLLRHTEGQTRHPGCDPNEPEVSEASAVLLLATFATPIHQPTPSGGSPAGNETENNR